MLVEFISNYLIPYILLGMFIFFALTSALVWTPLGGEYAKMDIRKQYKLRFFKQTYAIAVISPFVVFFLNRQGINVPFSDFQLIYWLENSTNYFSNESTELDRSIFDILDQIFLWSWRFLQYFMPPFFMIAFYRSRNSVIEQLLAGEIKRGIQFIKDNKEFTKLITIAAKETAGRLEKNLKIKLPSFYTARIFLGKHLVPIFKDLETKSIIFLGGAGSGKSVAIWEYIIPIIKYSNTNNTHFTWIVYDMKHDFYVKMFRKGKDVLFFPKHKDSAIWNMFREFHTITYDENGNKIWKLEIGELIQFVSYWMPTKEGDPSTVWIEKAQKAALAVLITVSKEYQNPSMKDFIDFTMQYNTKDKMVEKIVELGHSNLYGYNISAIFGETEAGSNVYEIFEQATTELRKLDFYFSDEEANFSINEFNEPLAKLTEKDIETLHVKDRNMDRRLFLVQDQKNTEYYSTAFRIILELQARKLLSLNQDLERRMFFLLDEAASLGKMTCVFDEIPEKGRSRGGALIVGLQTLAKFKGIYTEDIMNSILANIKTKVFMSIEDPYTQKWIKDSLDSTESERNSLSANEKDGGSVSYSVDNRDTLKASELAGIPVNTGFLRVGLYLTKIEFRIQKIKNNAYFEENKNITESFRTEFGQEEEININQRREEVINAIIDLRNKSNKPITPQNVNFIIKKSLESVNNTLNLIKEEQEQILTTITQMVKIEGYSYNELSLKELNKRTGLEINVIQINYLLIKLNEMKYIEKISKYIEKIESSGVEFKSENEKIKQLIAISGEPDSTLRESYQKIKNKKFYPDELPFEVIEKKNEIKETYVPETSNVPNEDLSTIEKLSEKRRLEREKRIQEKSSEEQNKENKETYVPEVLNAPDEDLDVNKDEDLSHEVNMSFLDTNYEDLDVQMPDEELVIDQAPDNPYQ